MCKTSECADRRVGPGNSIKARVKRVLQTQDTDQSIDSPHSSEDTHRSVSPPPEFSESTGSKNGSTVGALQQLAGITEKGVLPWSLFCTDLQLPFEERSLPTRSQRISSSLKNGVSSEGRCVRCLSP